MGRKKRVQVEKVFTVLDGQFKILEDPETEQEYKFIVQYAKSSRARCRSCSQNIVKGSVRVGIPTKWRGGEYGYISCWSHAECKRSEIKDKKKLAPLIYGLEELTKAEKKNVLDNLTSSEKTEAEKSAIDPNDVEFWYKQKRKVIPKPTPEHMIANLLPFQKEGFGWMLDQESRPISGGILADQMGMGKTIQTIALLVESKNKNRTGKAQPTLIVCPASAMLQWLEELERWTDPGFFKILVYYGAQKDISVEDIQNFDVVLTTYQTIEAEWRGEINQIKIECEYCKKKYLPRTLIVHLHYFCGPDAVRTEKLKKRERKYAGAKQKAMKTLRIGTNSSSKGFVPTPMNVYREIMSKANREPVKMYQKIKGVPSREEKKEPTTAKKRKFSENETSSPTKRPKVMKSIRSMTVAELKNLLKENDIPFSPKSRKGTLLELASPLEKNKPAELKLESMKVIELRKYLLSYKAYIPDGAKKSMLLTMATNLKNSGYPYAKGSLVRAIYSETGEYYEAKVVDIKSGKQGKERYKIEWSDGDETDLWKVASEMCPVPKVSSRRLLGSSEEFEDDEKTSKYFKKPRKRKRKNADEPTKKKRKKNGKDKKKKKKEAKNKLGQDEEDLMGESDVDLSECSLFGFTWDRLILDEAHRIKSRTTNTAKAIYALKSKKKWCLTGTPLQNNVGELYSLVRFLRMDPYAYYFCACKGCTCKSLTWQFGGMNRHCRKCGHPPLRHYSQFNKSIINPIKRYGYMGDGKTAMKTLKTDILDEICLRRTKEGRAEDLKLAPLTIVTESLTLTEKELDFYEMIYKGCTAKFDAYVSKGTLLHNYAHIFDLLSRLRQTVDHPYMVVHANYEGKLDTNGIQVKPIMPSNEKDICSICKDATNEESCVTSACGHHFHRNCVLTYMADAPESDEGVGCPVCYQPLSIDLRPKAKKPADAAPPPPKPKSKHKKGSILRKIDLDKFESSTKLESLVKALQDIRKGVNRPKSLVFSQYTTFLEIVEWRLNKLGIRTVKLTGSIPVSSRQKLLKAFKNDPNIEVAMLSLRAGGEGLNLQCASHVFVMEPWWNPAVELQAIQRAHRIGQTRPVKAVRFITKGTIEERMSQLQEKKQLVFDGCVDGKIAALSKLTEEDLRFLFKN